MGIVCLNLAKRGCKRDNGAVIGLLTGRVSDAVPVRESQMMGSEVTMSAAWGTLNE